jgi:integrase
MNDHKQEPSRLNNTKMLKANSIESTKLLHDIFVSDKKLEKLTKGEVLEFFKRWVKKRNKIELILPYKLNNMLFQLSKIVKYYLKDKKYLPIIKQSLKKEANKLARTLFTDKHHAQNKANTFTLHEVEGMIINLWYKGIPEKETAIMLIFSFSCGNRIGDLQFTNWSDLKFESKPEGRFIVIPLKVSKTNPMALKIETITIKIRKRSVWDVERKLEFLKNLKRPRDSDRIFNNRTTKSFVYYMEKARKELHLKNPISAHSGRNSCVERMLLAGVNSDNICVAFNWTRGSDMLYRYRNKLIETSVMGAQHALCEYDNAILLAGNPEPEFGF